MRDIYNKIDAIINKVDYESIWSGFSRYPFALYNKENVYLKDEVIPYDTRFLGNTSIEYEGGFLAIWDVGDLMPECLESFASDIIHEMFHAFQRERNETRYPDDLVMLDYPNWDMTHWI